MLRMSLFCKFNIKVLKKRSYFLLLLLFVIGVQTKRNDETPQMTDVKSVSHSEFVQFS